GSLLLPVWFCLVVEPPLLVVLNEGSIPFTRRARVTHRTIAQAGSGFLTRVLDGTRSDRHVVPMKGCQPTASGLTLRKLSCVLRLHGRCPRKTCVAHAT